MIFKEVDKILSGRKTQTRRVVKAEDFYEVDCDDPFCDTPDYYISTIVCRMGEMTRTGIKSRARWQVGRTYAVVPKRGLPTVWWRDRYFTGEYTTISKSWRDGYARNGHSAKKLEADMKADGWQPLRIRITAIRRERLQDISEADVRAEGVESVESVEAYRVLWDSINTRKGTRWQDCPDVWVLSFEVVREAA